MLIFPPVARVSFTNLHDLFAHKKHRMEDQLRILVVEDQEHLADLLRDWLSERYRTTVAYTGEQALDALGPAVDIVFLDRRLPDSSGQKVLNEIQTRGLDCRVTIITAVAPDFDVLDMGFDDYLVKPITKEEVIESVERLNRRTQYQEELEELLRLVHKQTLLRGEKSQTELDANDRYQALSEEIETQFADLQQQISELDGDDFELLFRRLDGPASTESL